ncbi:TolC family protein [Verrucomicrobia bacterium S94]|nr:TolC family protein [Pontiellaceae bacterium B12219]QBG46100.1 TolC family protein [Verrucomicrobia bacterium S94]
MKTKAIVTFLLLFPLIVLADNLGSNLTLRAVLQIGEMQNPGLQASHNQWKATEEQIAVKKALPDPSISYGYYFEPVETRVGPQNQRFSVSQKFPGFGKLSLKKSIAQQESNAVQQKVQQTRLRLNHRITKAYADLYYLKRSIDVTEDRIRLVRDLEQIARTRYSAGAPLGATLQAQVELGRLEDQLAALNDQRKPHSARLNTLLNRPENAPLAWPQNVDYMPVLSSPEELRSSIARFNPELGEWDQRIEQSEQQIKLAKRERYPDFFVGLQYIQTGEAEMAVPDSGQDAIIGSVGITLPIWAGKNRARIQSASYQKTAAMFNRVDRQQELESALQEVLFQLRDADRKINLYKASLIPKARQSLEVNRKGYESGTMEFINLIDAERMLLEFELSYERARADHLIARARLSQLTGTDFLINQKEDSNESVSD